VNLCDITSSLPPSPPPSLPPSLPANKFVVSIRPRHVVPSNTPTTRFQSPTLLPSLAPSHPPSLPTCKGIGYVNSPPPRGPQQDAHHTLAGVLGDAVVVVDGREEDEGVDDDFDLGLGEGGREGGKEGRRGVDGVRRAEDDGRHQNGRRGWQQAQLRKARKHETHTYTLRATSLYQSTILSTPT